MSLVVIFDEGASPEKVLGVVRSADTPDFSARTDVVINPDIDALDGVVPQKYWKHDTGSIIEFAQAEKDAQDAADVAAADASMRSAGKSLFDGQTAEGQEVTRRSEERSVAVVPSPEARTERRALGRDKAPLDSIDREGDASRSGRLVDPGVRSV